jgi:NDP-sugar pyrophosphorylase family protein
MPVVVCGNYSRDQIPMTLQRIDAVILCGGLGTRLREETEFRPKPMIEIGGKPMLWHIMRRYHKYRVRRLILCLGYRGEAKRDDFLSYRFRNADLSRWINGSAWSTCRQIASACGMCPAQ